MSLSGASISRVFVDDRVSAHGIIKSVIRQIGFALVGSVADADVCVSLTPMGDRLSWTPGTEFAVCGRVATFSTEAVLGLERYWRRTGRLEYAGRSFDIRADHGGKGKVLGDCIRTLFQLLLDNDQDVRFLWWFPDAARGVINYRIDVDDNCENSFDRVANMLEQHMKWCSIYFTTSRFVSQISSIRRSHDGGAEVGSHGHYHYTFERDPATNASNLQKSIEFLRQQGFQVCGFVTPSGKSFRGIGSLMADMGIRYTSNFGLIFDALPFEFADDKAVHLEVPIHPVAPGNVAKMMASVVGLTDYLTAYYLDIAEQLSQSFLPIFFYGHDNDTVNIDLLPRLLDQLVGRFPDHAFVTLGHYAAFWHDRLDQLSRWRPDLGDDGPRLRNIAVIQHHQPNVVNIQGETRERSWPVAVDGLLRSPLAFVGEGTKKPRWRDRFADRYEFETVLPISALSLISAQGWKSAGYKIIHRALRALFR